ncbi:restriction endonuclease subunit S, partial [Thiolapillus sp.]
TTVKHLSHTTVEKTKWPIPIFHEQQKIAHCLSSLDEVIGLQAKKVQALKQHKKGLMQQLFPAEGETTPRLRFPDFREAGAWEVKRLAEIGEIVTGTTPSTKKAEYYEDGIHLWVTPTDIGEEKDITETKIKLSEEGLQAGRFVPRNSLLVTCIASIGKNAILRMDGSCNQQINAITRFQGACVDFLYYLIERNTPVLLNTAGQGGMAILNKNDFSNLRFPFPALREQQKIAHCL